jgi:SagB-type dehydrogenase family enzyme
MEDLQPYRAMLKADRWAEWEKAETDERREVPAPPVQKPYPEDAALVDLVAPEAFTVGTMPLVEAIRRRRSHRQFSQKPLSLEELSFLLWATQGVNPPDTNRPRILRTAPSGGNRHPFETYLLVRRVEGVEPGLYRYLPLEHKLLFLKSPQEVNGAVQATWGTRRMMMESAVVFLWAAIPYRAEWRFSVVAHKIIAQDSGHLCQNLYLAAEAIGAGTCAVGAYDQQGADAVAGVDGEEEFAIYLAPVGKVDA